MADPAVDESPREIPRCRPFNTVDAMILVAAVAGFMGHLKWSRNHAFFYVKYAFQKSEYVGTPVVSTAALTVGMLHGFALALLSAFVLIRFRSPRPAPVIIARQVVPPSIVAALALILLGLSPVRDRSVWEPISDVCVLTGLGIVLGIVPALRPKEVGWIARMGTILVGLWVLDLLVWCIYATLSRDRLPLWDRWLGERFGL